MKIVQNALFMSCCARFSRIAFLSVKVLKIVTLAWNSCRNGKTVRFRWKLYKTIFSGHAEHVLPKSHLWASKFSKSPHWPEILAKTGKQSVLWNLYKTLFSGHAVHVLAELPLWAWKFSKSSHWPEILAETGKLCALDENCTKGSFQVMRSTFWPNRIFERQSSQNRQTGLKFSPNRENSALLITIVQNALFRSCAARFGQIAFLTVKLLKMAKLGWNSLQDG